MKKINLVRQLSPSGIGEAIEEVTSFLNAGKCDKKDVLRLSLSLENALLNFMDDLGEESTFQINCTKFFNTLTVTASASGRDVVNKPGDDDNFDAMMNRMLQAGSIHPEYSYENGTNRVKFEIRVKSRLTLTQRSLIAIGAGVVFGVLSLLFLPADLRTGLNDRIVSPLFSTFIGVVAAVAGLMVFLTVTQSIYFIGDKNSFQKVGGRFFKSTLLIMIGVSAVCTVACSFLFKSGATQSGQLDLYQVYDIILQIVPTNVVSPFLNGSILQILFMSVVLGVVILVLGSRVTIVKQFLDQCNDIINHVMEYIIKLMPYSVALSVFSLVVGSELSNLTKVLKLLLVFVVMVALCIVISIVYTALRWKKPLPKFTRDLMPVLITAFTTASSSAVLPMSMDICTNKMGIEKKLTTFGMPMSIAVYKLGSVIYRVVLVFGLAEIFGIAITPVWMITCVILCFCMSIAVPAVPGGGMSTLALLLAQLGIPAEALALALACDIIMDRFSTACNTVCDVAELVNVAGSLKMMNTNAGAQPKAE